MSGYTDDEGTAQEPTALIKMRGSEKQRSALQRLLDSADDLIQATLAEAPPETAADINLKQRLGLEAFCLTLFFSRGSTTVSGDIVTEADLRPLFCVKLPAKQETGH